MTWQNLRTKVMTHHSSFRHRQPVFLRVFKRESTQSLLREHNFLLPRYTYKRTLSRPSRPHSQLHPFVFVCCCFGVCQVVAGGPCAAQGQTRASYAKYGSALSLTSSISPLGTHWDFTNLPNSCFVVVVILFNYKELKTPLKV